MKLLVALAVILLLFGCQQEEEYVVRDLTTYRSGWNLPGAERDSLYEYDHRNWINTKLDSHIIGDLPLLRLNRILKDTTAITIYVRSYWPSKGYPSSARLTLSANQNHQIAELCDLALFSESPPYRSTDNIDSALCRQVELKDNQTKNLLQELVHAQIWKTHSFILEQACIDCPLIFIEIRDDDRYKLVQYHGEPFFLMMRLLKETNVCPECVAEIQHIIESDSTEIDSLSHFDFSFHHERLKEWYDKGYFDTDSTWLVE